jgi:hypothetical protein
MYIYFVGSLNITSAIAVAVARIIEISEVIVDIQKE